MVMGVMCVLHGKLGKCREVWSKCCLQSPGLGSVPILECGISVVFVLQKYLWHIIGIELCT